MSSQCRPGGMLLAAAFALVMLVPAAQSADAPNPLKLLRYGPAGQEKPGLLDSAGNIRDLSKVVADITPAQLSAESLSRLSRLDLRRLPVVAPGARLGPPVAGVRKIVAVGLNYAAHAAEGGSAPPPEPILFLKAISSLSGPNDPVVRPKGSVALDYEAELVIVIGKTARNVSEAEAGQYIAGYALGNDVSERDFQQRRSGQWTKGKSADTFAPFGPYLVAADAVRQDHLDVWLKVNGQERQHANTANMIFKSHFLVSYISQFMSLQPGDLIYTGTPEGVGAGMKPPTWLQPGDNIRLGISGLGEQHQTVVAWEDSALAGDEDQLRGLEQHRLKALLERNAAALQALLADDYLHVHATGAVEDRAEFIKGVVARPRETLRGALRVRVYGDLAVIDGEQTNRFANPDGSTEPPVAYYATQVAHREQGHWRFVSMQVTPIRDVAYAPSAKVAAYPAATAATTTAAQRNVAAVEARRTAAIASKDFPALASVLADDYLHVYGGGTFSDRAGYIEQVRKAPRVPTRGPLKVRLYGDNAIITGALLNRIQYPEGERALDTVVTQVLHRFDGQWKFVSFQITPR